MNNCQSKMLYHCSTCNKSFRSQQSLDQHLASLIHTFNCDVCNRDFKSQQSYDQHIQNSPVHKISVPVTSNVQPSTAMKLHPLEIRNSTLGQLADLRQKDTVALTSSIPPVAKHNRESAAQGLDYRWSVVSSSQQPALLDALLQSCHSLDDLQANKYRLALDTAEDLAGLRKCRNCGGLAKNIQKRANVECIFHPKSRDTSNQYRGQKPYPCCGGTTRGCTSLPTHDFANPDPKIAAKNRTFASTPPSSPLKPKFRAVTLDCEMAWVKGGGSEVILICAADYFTGAVLLNQHVYPTEAIIDWRTRIHGITRSAMQTALRTGQALAGWKAARAALWKCIDADTILIGHALQHDLDVLRILHAHVVDSAILARNAVGTAYRQWGLKPLCDELLGVAIRRNVQGVHDCREDVLATRELVLWCTRNPRELGAWAAGARREEERKKEERARAQRQKAEMLGSAESRGAKGPNPRPQCSDPESSSAEDEVLHWSDVAEDCGWPHPDTGYDPWSD